MSCLCPTGRSEVGHLRCVSRCLPKCALKCSTKFLPRYSAEMDFISILNTCGASWFVDSDQTRTKEHDREQRSWEHDRCLCRHNQKRRLPYRGYKGQAAGTFRAGQHLITASVLPPGKVPHKTEYQEKKDVWGRANTPT